MFWACDIFPAHASYQSKKIFSALHSRERVHPVQFFLLVGPLQSHGPPLQQGKITLHIGLPHNINRYKRYNNFSTYSTHYFPIATLYFAMGLQSAILTPIAAVLQVFDNTHMHWVNKHFIFRLLLFCGLLSATSPAARLASSSLQNSSQVSVDPRSIETFQFNDNHVI